MSLDRAFTQLREKGYFAKRNFWCCNTCAWAEVPVEFAEKAVFIHEQNEDRIADTGTGYIGWSGDGNEICEVLRANGVVVEWDGSEDTAIEVTV